MNDYSLTKQAELDLLDVFLFGYEQFGSQQAETSAATLEHTFQLLAGNPLMGRKAGTIALGVRRHEHGSHIILYEEAKSGVLILAVVHRSSVKRLAL